MPFQEVSVPLQEVSMLFQEVSMPFQGAASISKVPISPPPPWSCHHTKDITLDPPILTSSTHVENSGIPSAKFLSGSSVDAVSAKGFSSWPDAIYSSPKPSSLQRLPQHPECCPRVHFATWKGQEVLGCFSQTLLQCSIQIHLQASINLQLRADAFPSFSFLDPPAPSWCPSLVPFPLAQGFLELQNSPVLVHNHIFASVQVLKSKRTMSATLKFWFFHGREIQRLQWLRGAAKALLCCWELPWVAQKPSCYRETPNSFLQVSSVPNLQKSLCHQSQAASLGLCPSSLALRAVTAGHRKEQEKGKVKGIFPLLSVLCNVLLREPNTFGLPLTLFQPEHIPGASPCGDEFPCLTALCRQKIFPVIFNLVHNNLLGSALVSSSQKPQLVHRKCRRNNSSPDLCYIPPPQVPFSTWRGQTTNPKL